MKKSLASIRPPSLGQVEKIRDGKPPAIPDDVYAWLMKITELGKPTLTDSLAYYGWQECLRSIREKVNAAKNQRG